MDSNLNETPEFQEALGVLLESYLDHFSSDELDAVGLRGAGHHHHRKTMIVQQVGPAGAPSVGSASGVGHRRWTGTDLLGLYLFRDRLMSAIQTRLLQIKRDSDRDLGVELDLDDLAIAAAGASSSSSSSSSSSAADRRRRQAGELRPLKQFLSTFKGILRLVGSFLVF